MNRRGFLSFFIFFFLFIHNFKLLNLKKYKYYNKENLVWFLDIED